MVLLQQLRQQQWAAECINVVFFIETKAAISMEIAAVFVSNNYI